MTLVARGGSSFQRLVHVNDKSSVSTDGLLQTLQNTQGLPLVLAHKRLESMNRLLEGCLNRWNAVI